MSPSSKSCNPGAAGLGACIDGAVGAGNVGVGAPVAFDFASFFSEPLRSRGSLLPEDVAVVGVPVRPAYMPSSGEMP
ncbi:MAG TPA: hypothetical protein VK948_07745, partial [Aeromicrobium sp.]|nr:hypothetical protein [Aeromicrobium sp.]